MAEVFRARAFGLDWQADLPLPLFRELEGPASAPDLRIARAERLPPRAGGVPINRGWIHDDGVRFVWEDVAAFDMTRGERIDYVPGPAWGGALPDTFYSTVAALTLAWRGPTPFHASTVEIDGRAVLIAGASGAGKSTLAAALAAQGARWLADDLSAVECDASGRFVAHQGRRAARLHAAVGAWIAATELRRAGADPNAKRVVALKATASAAAPELAAMLLLGRAPGPVAAAERAPVLMRQVFRPRWLGLLPNASLRRRQMLDLAARIPVLGLPAAEMRDAASFSARGAEALAAIRSALR